MAEPGKPLCFVIMPFSADYDEIYETIKNAGSLAGFNTERADEQFAPDRVPERIQNLLESAAVLVAEISETNPNVYYELGLAHANSKPVVLICREGVDVPFDISQWNRINYKDIRDLALKLAQALMTLFSEFQERPVPKDRKPPEDLEVGQLAVKCGMITPASLDASLQKIQSDTCDHSSLLDLLVASEEINEEQAGLLSQAQEWVTEYLSGISRSQGEPTWIKRLHRTVKFVSCRNRERGDSPVETRFISLLGKEIEIFDEAIYTDHIFFQKFKEGTFTARSTGIVVLHEMETDYFKCSVPDSLKKYYRNSEGHSLDYTISVKEGSSFPLLVERTFTYLNGFQLSADEDNRECGIRIREPVEELILTVDFEMLPITAGDIKAELRLGNETKDLELKAASERCFYTNVSYPQKESAIYIKWRWDE